jgi:glycosyltransferase involved in cell wall biosynthesis
VHRHEWLGYIGQRNYLRELARYPWVLYVDADEEISPSLRREIVEEFERGTGECLGYQFPRQVFYLGKWIRHGLWYPDIKLRLFKKAHGVSKGREPHDHVHVDGPVKTLASPIWHYTYDDLSDHMGQSNRFSTIAATEMFRAGQRFRWRDFFFRPGWRFFRDFVLRRGFQEGFRGLLIALIGSHEVVMKYAKLWERQLEAGLSGGESPPPGSGGTEDGTRKTESSARLLSRVGERTGGEGMGEPARTAR